MNKPTYLLFAVIPLAVITLQTPGQTVQRNMFKEKAILDRLQKINPKAVKNFESGTDAIDRDDYSSGAKFYELVLKDAPDFNPALRRLGLCLAFSGQTDQGRQMLEKALKAERSPENLSSVAQVLAYPAQNVAVPEEDKRRALGLASEALRVAPADADNMILVAQLSLDLDSEVSFRSATATLVQFHPELMQTHYFNAIRAASDDQLATAESEIKTAGKMGLPAEVVDRFLDHNFIHTKQTLWNYLFYSLYPIGAWAVGLVLLFAFGKILSFLTLRSIELDDPNEPDSRKHALLRKLYRKLISVGGFYYYMSLPLVTFLVLAIAGAGIYIGFKGNQFRMIIMIVFGVLATSYSLIRSLFVRRKLEDPGRPLRVDEAPGLWDLAGAVARKVGTRPVDEIRVTPGTEMAVYETGASNDLERDKGHRVLILGIGLLNGFSQNSFRAVLAHEYGHLNHRDTAGGEVALRVNENMREFAVAMARAGQAVWWNIAFHFLRLYHFIFRRISHGATRLQEVLADRVAVAHYGAGPFEDGLSHVVKRGIEFHDTAYRELVDAKNNQRVARNLYELEPNGSRGLDDKIKASMNRPTTQDDTHPGPLDRFRYASKIVSKAEEPVAGMVWDLFVNRESLTSEMSATIGKRVRV